VGGGSCVEGGIVCVEGEIVCCSWPVLTGDSVLCVCVCVCVCVCRDVKVCMYLARAARA